MNQQRKIILALAFVTTFFLVEILLGESIKVYGQTKGKPVGIPGIGRDPFSLPSGVRLLSKTDPGLAMKRVAPPPERVTPLPETKPVDVLPPSLTVKAILISDHVRLASINRHIVTVGDSIQDEKVLEIHADRVILGKRDKKRTILLSQSPIRLTVDETQGGKK